jgi:hypothetical protein
MPENLLLKSALEYANKGWFVFPCREKESEPFFDTKKNRTRVMKVKSPYIKNGFHTATTDMEQIKGWWGKYPNAAIGISCEASNLAVVDIDVKDGRNGFENFMRMNVSDAGALHGLTPSGGTHIIYSGQLESKTNTALGIDIRSKGAYIIAPPSKIETQYGNLAYMKLDNWDRIPIDFPTDLPAKLEIYVPEKTNENKNAGAKFITSESTDDLLKKAKLALDKLPLVYCDEYSTWIKVGLSLKSLGEEAFALWDSWSMKSAKYNSKDCLEKWESFRANSITIGTLFFLAKEAR